MSSEPLARRAERDAHGRIHHLPAAGDVVRLRRPHVCGADVMVVTHTGVDVRLSCSGCGAQLTLTRQRLRSRVAEVAGTLEDHPGLGGARS